ncbi:MAG TPA: carbamoyltransferase [Candidatus Angelobacter sp.]|nr:carbamoyltransferase [Candidatus Angelobacter sp.]
MTNIIGVSAHFHDAACCLLQDGNLVAAAEEERFSRQKHDPRIPLSAFNYCLREGGISIDQVDCVAYYERPARKLARQICTMLPALLSDPKNMARLEPRQSEFDIRERLGFEGPIYNVGHHEAHAASAFFFSGFSQAAILVADAVGEWDTTTYSRGCGNDLEIFESVEFPDSLGLLYSAITGYLGFEVNEGEYKVMGLAPYGKPIYHDRMRKLIDNLEKGQYRLNLKYFDFQARDRMHSDEMIALLGEPARSPGSEIRDFHKDVAASLQLVLEEILLAKCSYLHSVTGYENLCMAGGVALNCVANGKILRQGPFHKMFVQPAAGDAGGCLGAAALALRQMGHGGHNPRPLEHVFLGPAYDNDTIGNLIEDAGFPAVDFRGRETELLQAVASHLAEGRVVAWFQGRMEFGPRSLGSRSILADPRDGGMRDRINSLVKKRESFRPFAPSVIETSAAKHFDINHPSRFMLETCQVTSSLQLPAITHIDGSARVQTVDKNASPRFTRLLEAFEARTGCPILLNTSFNMKDEPIVCSPVDALVCFIRADIDILVLQDFVIERSAVGPACQLLFRSVRLAPNTAVGHRTYTFL